MNLIDHLGELRSRLMKAIAAVAVAAIAGWILYGRTVSLLIAPARPYLTGPTGDKLVITSPVEGFTLRFKVATYVGFAIAFPVVLWQLWRFIAPGLKSNERKMAVPFVMSGMTLFSLGVLFAYTTLPQALKFLISPAITGNDIAPLLTAQKYISFMLLYLLAFGLSFQFPIVIMFMTLARVVTSAQLAKYRRHTFLGIAVVAAFATPSVDLITMGVLTIALYVLYEGSIWLSRLLKR